MSVHEIAWEEHLLEYIRQQKPSAPNGDGGAGKTGATTEAGRTVSTVATTRLAAQPVHTLRPAGGHSPIVTQPPVTTKPTVVTTAPPLVKPFNPVVKLHPKWELAIAVLPHRTVDPAPSLAAPVRAGDFLLWPDPPRSRAFYTLAQPRMSDFSLTVRRETIGAGAGSTLGVTGGTAVFTLSVYADEDLAGLERHRVEWSRHLERAGHGVRSWRFHPLSLRNLEGAVDLPNGYAAGPPEIAASADSGRAAILVELTSLGAQAWEAALEEERPGSMQGLCRLSARYYAQLGDHVDVKTQALDASLGPLAAAAGVSRDSLRVVRPEVSVEAKFVVVGDDMVERVVLSMTPSDGHAPVTHTFDDTGGAYALALTSDSPESLHLDWTALVHFKPDGWPVVRHGGVMKDNTWAEMIKPDAWMQPFSLVVMLLDAAGNVVPATSEGAVDPSNRVYGEITYSAPYLNSSAPLRAGFDSSSQQLIEVQFPMPPGVPPGEIKLTVMSQRGGNVNMQTRILRHDETSTLVMVMHNAMINIQTNRDPSSEQSLASQVHGLVAQLQPQKPAGPPRTEAGGPDIVGPASHPVAGPPPTFEVDPSPNAFYVVEVATEPEVFDIANFGDLQTDANFYASDMDEPFLTAPRYALPMDVWTRMRRPGPLYYRIWTSAAADDWVDWDVTTPDASYFAAPSIQLTGATAPNADLTRLLTYLGVSHAQFQPYERRYFDRLAELLVMHGTIPAGTVLDQANFRDAVRDFQRGAGLGVDGLPGENTLWEMQEGWANGRALDLQRVDADTWVRPGLGAHQPQRDGFDSFRLRQDIVFRYHDLHDEMIAAGALLTSSGSFRDLGAQVTPGRSTKSMHYSGLALDLAVPTGMRDPDVDPFIITRDGDRWHVWARAVDGVSRTLDAVVWSGGATTTREVTADVVDFTAAAHRHGFRDIRARSCFPGDYMCAEWWHFQCEAALVPWISQFGTELLSLRQYTQAGLQVHADIWANRRCIFKRATNGWH